MWGRVFLRLKGAGAFRLPHPVFAFAALLLSGLIAVNGALSQAALCPDIVRRALDTLGDECGGLGRNQACYGYNQVSATFIEPQPPAFFTRVGDVSEINLFRTLRTTASDRTRQEWGIAVLNVQANLPGTLPGQNAVFLLTGEGEIESALDPETAFVGSNTPVRVTTTAQTALRLEPLPSADVVSTVVADVDLLADARTLNAAGETRWLRVALIGASPEWDQAGWIELDTLRVPGAVNALPVFTPEGAQASYTPLQTFFLRSGLGQPSCGNAPDVLVVQGPENLRIQLNINGADVVLGSTVVFRTDARIGQPIQRDEDGNPISDLLTVQVIDGEAVINPGQPFEVVIPEGEQSNICLDDPQNLGIDGETNDQLVTDACGGWTPPRAISDAEYDELRALDGEVLNYEIVIPDREAADTTLTASASSTHAIDLTGTQNALLTATANRDLPSSTPTGTETSNPTASRTPGGTGTPAPPVTASATASATTAGNIVLTATPTPSPTATTLSTNAATNTRTSTPTRTSTLTPTNTATNLPTATPTNTALASYTPSHTPTATYTASGGGTADIGVTKSASVSSAYVGDVFNLIITASNSGPATVNNLEIAGSLPPQLSYTGGGSATQGFVSGGVWYVGRLRGGESATLTLEVRADAPGCLTSTAYVQGFSGSVRDQNPTNDTASVTVEVYSRADLSISGNVSNNNPAEGDTVTYDYTVTNNGLDDLTSTRVTDLLPAGVTLATPSASRGSYTSASDTWTIGTMNAGASATLQLTVTVNSGTGGTSLTNTATVADTYASDPDTSDNSLTHTLTVTSAAPAQASLSLGLNVSLLNILLGGEFDYDVQVLNSGPDAVVSLLVDVSLPAGFSEVSSSSTQGTLGGSTWDVGTLASGAQATFYYRVRADTLLPALYTFNSAILSFGGATDPDTSDNSDSEGVTVGAASDLAIVGSVSDDEPDEGDIVTYSYTVTNNGPGDLSNISALDLLPDSGVTFTSFAPSGASYTSGSDTWSIGTLASGGSVTLDIYATVNNGTSGTSLTNTASVSDPDNSDPNGSNDFCTVTITPDD